MFYRKLLLPTLAFSIFLALFGQIGVDSLTPNILWRSYFVLTPIFKEKIMTLIKEQSNKKGFIITDQDYRAILEVSTRVVLLREGGLINIKSSEELGYWGYTPW